MLYTIQLQTRRTQQERAELHGHRGDNCHVQSLTLSRVLLSLPGMFSCLWDSIMTGCLQLWVAVVVSHMGFKS